MLLRRNNDGRIDAIDQAHHAHLSGVLAGGWRRRHDPRLVAAITLHDDPWRDADADPPFDQGLPYDFINYPLEDRLQLYAEGIDRLEPVDSYVAYLVSLHYTTFAGTRDVQPLQRREEKRRERLAPLIDDAQLDGIDDDLRWMKYFDVLSLHICLTGPDVDSDDLPSWLRDPSTWSTAPDDTSLEFHWEDRDRLRVEPWPFAGAEFHWELRHRRFDGPFDNEESFRQAFAAAAIRQRTIRLVPQTPD